MKLGNSKFFRWLAANLWSKVQNSKFYIQYGRSNFEKLQKLKNVYETRSWGVFSVAEDEFEVQIVKNWKSEVECQKLQIKSQKLEAKWWKSKIEN